MKLCNFCVVVLLFLAAVAGYVVGSNTATSDEMALSASAPDAAGSGVNATITMYVAEDKDNNDVPSRGDMVSFFIPALLTFNGPWVIDLTCWSDQSRTVMLMSAADTASMNQPFYRLGGADWPKGETGFCEWIATQDGLPVGTGNFPTW